MTVHEVSIPCRKSALMLRGFKGVSFRRFTHLIVYRGCIQHMLHDSVVSRPEVLARSAAST